MPRDEQRPPLQPGESAPRFILPRADRDGTVSLADYRGRPVLLTLMRGLQCPFCRRNIIRLGQMAPALKQIGVETLAIIGTTPERSRLYVRYRPSPVPLAADADLATHRQYGIPCYPMSPELGEQYRTIRVDPFHELPEPVPFVAPDGTEIHDVFDRLDAFVPNDVDQRDRTRQFRQSVQLCGQYLLDGDGIVHWTYVEGQPGGLARAGVFPGEATVLAAARSL